MKSFCLAVLILALVMGNSIYSGLSPPSNDARKGLFTGQDVAKASNNQLRTNFTNLVSKVSAGYTYRS